MLTQEVVILYKKFLLIPLALLLSLAANLRPVCTVSIHGTALPGTYAPMVLRRCQQAACAAAEEICASALPSPEAELLCRLSLRSPSGDEQALSSALLESCEGVVKAEAIYIDREYLGLVEDKAELQSKLRLYIENQLPTWAERGYLSRSMVTEPRYTRPSLCTSPEDMILLASGVAPVLYSDGRGYVARA